MKDAQDQKENYIKAPKFKTFKELEEEDFKDLKLDDFKKSQFKEFREKELPDFKKFLKYWNSNKKIEDLRSRLNSDDELKDVLKELDKIGLDGRVSLKLLEMIKNNIN